MIDPGALFRAGLALATMAVIAWAVSAWRKDVSIVDSLWSLFFLVAATVYLHQAGAMGPRAGVVMILVAAWALRLSVYITWRNRGQPEDYRYRQIRANHEPGFRWKSFYIVFLLQAALAWVISLPLAAAISTESPWSAWDWAGLAVWAIGLAFEAGGDWQLARFLRNPDNRGAVLDRGLWRYSRHPNYFGNCLIWWGFWLFALSAGGWWTVVSPLLMSFLLLRVSGVALLERDIGDRRPAYRTYVRRTNAFFPGPRRA